MALLFPEFPLPEKASLLATFDEKVRREKQAYDSQAAREVGGALPLSCFSTSIHQKWPRGKLTYNLHVSFCL